MMKKLFHALFHVATTLWVGGLVVLSILVAPVLFKTLGSRSQAGQAFGAILRAFGPVEIVCALVALGSAIGLACRAESRPWIHRARIGVLGLMTLLAAFHVAYVLPASHEARSRVVSFDSDASTPEEKESRNRFERLHELSVCIYGANILLGMVLVVGSALFPEFACKTRAGG